MILTVERAIAHFNDARWGLADLEATLADLRRRIGADDVALDAARGRLAECPPGDAPARTPGAKRRRATAREIEGLDARRDRAEDELEQRMRERFSAVLALRAAWRGAWAAIMYELAAQLDWTAINEVMIAAALAERVPPFETDIRDRVGVDDLTAALAARYGIPADLREADRTLQPTA